MQLLKEKELSAELAIDQDLLTLAQGRTTPPSEMAIIPFEENPTRKNTEKLMSMLFKEVPSYDPDLAQRLALSNWSGDPLSDEAILKIRRDGDNPHQVIDQFLNGGIEAVENPSPQLQTIWQQVSEDPEWLDWDKLELGAKTYRGYGSYGFQFQGIATLDGYRVRNISQTLMSTGQYSDDTAFKRFLLTCNFWTEVSEKGGMRKFSEGWKTALRVRLLHTLIRRAVFGSDRWDPEIFGMPINQAGLMAAPIISALVMGKASRMLGRKASDEEIEAMLHLWRYISYIMGYCADIDFPTTIKEGQKVLFHLMLSSQPSDDPDGIRLCKSFMDCFIPPKDLKGIEKISRWWEYKSNIAMTAFFVSPDTHKVANLPKAKFWGLMYFLTTVPINHFRSKRRLSNPVYAEKLDKKITKNRREWVNRQLNEADLAYRPQSKF